MSPNQYLSPYRIHELLSCCPHVVASYASLHLDTIAKILNHILILMFVFNAFLFFSSWNVSFLPTSAGGGINAVLVSFLLCCQNAVVWIVLNNHRISAFPFFAPTEFMLGVTLGITVGAALLSFILSCAFRQLSKCRTTTDHSDPNFDYLCTHAKGSASSIWFWGGLVFWLNFWSSLLLAVGRRELTTAVMSTQYEAIGSDDPNNQFAQQPPLNYHNQQAASTSQQQNLSGPSFVGDYATVPEIRGEGGSGGKGPITTSV